GVSLGWRFPGWGRLIERFRFFAPLLERLDGFANPRPALADFVVSVWRPRPIREWPVDDYRVRPTNPVYQRQIAKEAEYWAKADFAVLGCDDLRWDAEWLRRGASERLDVYELSPGVIAKVRDQLGALAGRVRF